MPWTVVALEVAREIERQNRINNKTTTPISKFGIDRYPHDKESRRNAQFKFFGYKPKRFISIYAKKPRILVKPKAPRVENINYMDSVRAFEARMRTASEEALYQQPVYLNQQQSNIHNQLAFGQTQAVNNRGQLLSSIGMAGALYRTPKACLRGI